MTTPAAGSIYDLGYRHYEGVRLGRRHAIWALYLHSLRSVFGIGRSAWSKVAAFGILAIALIPAVVQLGVAAVAPENLEVVAPETYYQTIEPLLAVFCAIIAPDIAGRDQQSNTLSLYFSRALRREDYAFAKFGALVTGMLSITAVPQLLMFTGNAAAGDATQYLKDNWHDLPAILISATMLSSLVAGIGLVIAAQTPRRAYSTVGIVAAFVLTSVIAAAAFEASSPDAGRFILLFSAFHVVRGFTLWFFGAAPEPGTQFAQADLPGEMYAIAAVAATLLMLALLLRRYGRISP